MAVVGNRYAEALLSSASEKQIDKFESDLNLLSTLYKENNVFRDSMNNPRISNETKLEIIKETIKIKDQLFENFMDVVLKKGRISFISEISEKYTAMVNERIKKINIEIITASELKHGEIKEIVEKFKKMYEANEVEYKTTIDESIIGGIKVIVEDKVYDGTVATKLSKLLK